MIIRNLKSHQPAVNALRTRNGVSRRLNSASLREHHTPVNSILIANRGEIAIRVSKTVSQHGVRTTSVFTDPDAQSEHTLASPFSINLREPSAYLNGPKIIEAAKANGCDAIHPGYGFLSENAAFAKQCEEAGINFIGPSWQAIEAMGDKSRSKEIMLAANVPCTPGYHGDNQDPAFLQQRADQTGYPVLLKAVHGGGGKGMRIAQTPDTFPSQLESAKSEARNSFGNDTMLVEKYITRPRHVEVQIFGDKHGNVVALGERDCSIQRRHQKIIEESPAPGLTDAQRKDLWHKAVQAGKAVDYVGAGTVEFILDADAGSFYFMEMNTRLQVEHPVTEMCTGLDLVEWQLRVARGEPLPLSQEEIEARIAQRGHAVEARIYAEDPTMDFLPTAGTLTHLKMPLEEPDSVRVDTAIRQAPSTISSHYDPMISKLIVRGADRETAMKKLHAALEQYEVSGLTTNIEFLKQLCNNEAFISDPDALDTGFIGKHKKELFERTELPTEVAAQAALGLMLTQTLSQTQASANNGSLGFSGSGTKPAGFQSRTIELATTSNAAATTEGATMAVHIQHKAGDRYSATVSCPIDSTKESQAVEYSEITASIIPNASSQSFLLSTTFPHTKLRSTLVLPSSVQSADYKPSITLFDRGTRYELMIPPPAWLGKAVGKSTASAGEVSLAAPMPSKILRVETKEGDQVSKDQPLVVVESMKMEMVLRAPRDGLTVRKVSFKPGEICKAGAILVEFEDQEAKDSTGSD